MEGDTMSETEGTEQPRPVDLKEYGRRLEESLKDEFPDLSIQSGFLTCIADVYIVNDEGRTFVARLRNEWRQEDGRMNYAGVKATFYDAGDVEAYVRLTGKIQLESFDDADVKAGTPTCDFAYIHSRANSASNTVLQEFPGLIREYLTLLCKK